MKLSKNNTTGHSGVSYDKTNGKYRAYIGIAGMKISLGYFSNLDEAVKTREDAKKFFSFNNDGYRIANFVIDRMNLNKQYMNYAVSGLFKAFITYSWVNDQSFMVYAYNVVKNAIIERFEVEQNGVYKSFNDLIQNDKIVRDWIDGYSIQKIAKDNNQSVYYIKLYIKHYQKTLEML